MPPFRGAPVMSSAKVQSARRPPVGRVSAPVSLRQLARPTRAVPEWAFGLFGITDILTAYTVLLAAFLVLNIGHFNSGLSGFLQLRIRVVNLLVLLLLGFIWNRSFAAFGLYARSSSQTTVAEFRRVALACSIGVLPTLVLPVLSATGAFKFSTVALFWALSIPATAGVRAAVRRCAYSLARLRRRQILIVGSGPRAQALHREVCALEGLGLELIGFIDSSEWTPAPAIASKLIGGFADLERVLMKHVVDEVLIALPIKSCYREIEDAIHTCERLGVQSTYLSDIFEPSLGRVGYRHAHPFPMRTVKVVHDDARLIIKRVIDIVGSVVGIVVFSPLFLGVAVAIKLSSRGPVFFNQRRYGFNKRLFRMYKFRTMVVDAEALQSKLEDRNEATGPVFKIANDPRITRIGRFLRRTSLDELPQFLNVLLGEMSLVGPRPLAIRDVGRFEEGWLMRRFSMRPGLTCLWQTAGRSNLGFSDWVNLDLEYIDNWSLLLDCKIMIKTFPVVVRGTGAH